MNLPSPQFKRACVILSFSNSLSLFLASYLAPSLPGVLERPCPLPRPACHSGSLSVRHLLASFSLATSQTILHSTAAVAKISADLTSLDDCRLPGRATCHSTGLASTASAALPCPASAADASCGPGADTNRAAGRRGGGVRQVLLSMRVLLPRLVQLVGVPAPVSPRLEESLAHLPVSSLPLARPHPPHVSLLPPPPPVYLIPHFISFCPSRVLVHILPLPILPRTSSLPPSHPPPFTQALAPARAQMHHDLFALLDDSDDWDEPQPSAPAPPAPGAPLHAGLGVGGVGGGRTQDSIKNLALLTHQVRPGGRGSLCSVRCQVRCDSFLLSV